MEAQLKPPLPLTAGSKENWLLTVPAMMIPRFYRLHFSLKGNFFPQGFAGAGKSIRGCPVFAETSLSRKTFSSELNVSFPMGGLFRSRESCNLRDIFGFFSFPCGIYRESTMHIRNSPTVPRQLRIETQSGAEDRRNKSSSDEERYYMREYAPGDRFRDINWKSSERIDSLITRISPDNQDKVTRIEILFRNYGPPDAGINELWLLDRAKARLSWFLRSVKEEKQSYIFHVKAAGAEWELGSMDEIELFLDELAVLSFSPPENTNVHSDDKKEFFVFSTACDTGLSAFLLSLQMKPVSVFMVQNAGRDRADYLYLRDFVAGGSFPLPRWFFGRSKPSRRGGVSGYPALIDYAEVLL